ncbi:MAG: thiamine phosphate synthase [Paracoccus sp. (in: a-proteobacteria)]|nr:thiamine phosphate synthase [Paracoccus sp. (in: a-proteobacteria)]
MKPFDLSLYLVLAPDLCRAHDLSQTVRLAVAGGATMIQLRDKTADRAALIRTGRALRDLLDGSGVRLIINDDAVAAREIRADGLHIGQDDLSPAAARAIIGRKMILGQSVESPEAMARLDPSFVDYAGVGPVFATLSKPDHKPPIGFDGLARIIAQSPVPVVAIGGLKPDHVARALSAGAAGIAVVSAICGQPDPQAATRALRDRIEAAR